MKKLLLPLIGLIISGQVMGGSMTCTRSFSAVGYKAGINLTVTITTVSEGTFDLYAISDIIPAGWTYVSSNPTGDFNATDRKISWTNTTNPPATITYVVTPAGTVDPVTFSGEGTGYDGAVIIASFPNTNLPLIKAHPADTNGDGKITQLEYVAYAGPVAAVFKRGINGGEYSWDGATLSPKTSP